MQTITPELEALLKSKLQVGAAGSFKARVEVESGEFESIVFDSDGNGPGGPVATWQLPSVAAPGDDILLVAFVQAAAPPTVLDLPAGWNLRTDIVGGASSDIRYAMIDRAVPVASSPYADTLGLTSGSAFWSAFQAAFRSTGAVPSNTAAVEDTYPPPYATNPTVTAPIATPTEGRVLLGYASLTTDTGPVIGDFVWPVGWVRLEVIGGHPHVGQAEIAYKVAEGDETDVEVIITSTKVATAVVLVAEYPIDSEPLLILSVTPKGVSIDKSLRLVADQAEVELANEDYALGWGPDSLLQTNQRCRIFQWYGAPENAIRTFTGIIDRHHEHRDVSSVAITLRDMMAVLIDQTFSATAPQGATEVGAARTEDNGVYLNREVSYIVNDLADRAGWPAAARDIVTTSYVLDEFVVQDGASWASTIIGKEKLTGLVGYSCWSDEFGVLHFAPTSVSQNLTEPVAPVYTFRTGEDILELDDETDQYAMRTRIKVRGPLTTTTLQDTWRELWRTSKFHRPVGLWHDPADAANLRVLDRGTKRLYKLRQSDRKVLSSVNLGAAITYPLGLSGDPSDATVYWVLNAPWIYTGSTSGNSVKKVRKSDNVVLATYSIPNGRWSALKVSAAFLWLTNLDTDRFYKKDKSDGSAIANYQHTVGATTQANPSGMMVDGTTLYVFWSNGGTTARFLKCDESAPGTVTDVVKTAGTVLHGGEMDTVTHTECYGDSDSLGLVAKFTLLAAVDQTNEVYAEVVDTELEDELGTFAQLEPRVHDTHSGDAAHPYEIRRDTLDLKLITSLAQATETAQRQLDLVSHRRRVLDAGVIGNPALQKTDPVEVIDPVTGISESFVIDTYRSQMRADGTYLGTVALLPVEALDDTPDDDGDAS